MTIEEDFPIPYRVSWHEGHKIEHLAMYPGSDADVRAELDLQIEAEWARTVGV